MEGGGSGKAYLLYSCENVDNCGQPLLNDLNDFKVTHLELETGSVSASHMVGREFASRPGHTKSIIKMVQTASLHRHACVRVGVWQCSPTA